MGHDIDDLADAQDLKADRNPPGRLGWSWHATQIPGKIHDHDWAVSDPGSGDTAKRPDAKWARTMGERSHAAASNACGSDGDTHMGGADTSSLLQSSPRSCNPRRTMPYEPPQHAARWLLTTSTA
jgi:hypothetical protein